VVEAAEEERQMQQQLPMVFECLGLGRLVAFEMGHEVKQVGVGAVEGEGLMPLQDGMEEMAWLA
jgi:hypothetical protein